MSKRRSPSPAPAEPAQPAPTPARRRETTEKQRPGGSFVDGKLVHRTAPPPETAEEE